MKRNITNLLALILMCSMSSVSLSEEAEGQVQDKPSKYVNITFEIHGLEESVGLLKNASNSLAEAMKRLENQDGEIDSQDLERIERIAASMESVAAKIDKTLQETGPTIQRAKEPTVELVSAIVQETKVGAIDPVVASVQGTVSESVSEIKWSLIWVGIVFLLAVIVFGVLMFKSLQQLNGMTSTVREAFEKGEFVFRLKEENKEEDKA